MPIIVTGVNVRHNSRENTIHQTIHKEAVYTHDQESAKRSRSSLLISIDIAGPTNTIQMQGDQAGRSIPDMHYCVLSEIVHEFRGKVIEKRADPITAYFIP